MPHPLIHGNIDGLLGGRIYQAVHGWIDGTFDGTNGRIHWINRHHLKAINEKYPIGSIENTIARMHVVMDWMWYYYVICLPKNRQEVIIRLKEHGWSV